MSVSIQCRKTAVFIENVWHAGGPRLDMPLRKGAIAAVVANPYAGAYQEDLLPWMKALESLGDSLADELLDALGVPAEDIQSFGKGVMVGVNGDAEIGAAWHAPGGGGIKRALGGVKGFVTMGEVIANAGDRLHIPMVSVHSPWVRSHFDGVSISIADAPRPDEVVYALAIANGGRVHARLGGVTFAEGASGKGPAF